MSDAVVYDVEANTAFLTFNNPPVNALSAAVRQGICDGLDRAIADDGIDWIVLIGSGRTFPAGADIAEFDHPFADPGLPEVCNRIEACAKPVVAAIHGTALGGGLEVALAAHYRIAHVTTRIGLPEIKLGLLPGAGGTQRTPRIAGARIALDLMLSGRPTPVQAPSARALVDAVTDQPLRDAALDFVTKHRAIGAGPRPSRDRRDGFSDPIAFQSDIVERRKRLGDTPELAASKIVDCIEAAQLLPFDAGLALENASFEECLGSPVSTALRHAFFAERRAQKFPEFARASAADIKRIAVAGGGPLAEQLAVATLNSGLELIWCVPDGAARKLGHDRISAVFERAVQLKTMDQAGKQTRLSRLHMTGELTDIKRSDFVIIAEKGLGEAARPDGVPRAMALSGKVGDVGLRFARPAFSRRCVEVICGPNGSPQQIVAAVAAVRAMGKVAVRNVSEGQSIAGRMISALQRGADALLDLGATPYEVDKVAIEMGFEQGPFQIRDAFGLSLTEAEHRTSHGLPDWSAVLSRLDRKGAAVGFGFYSYVGADRARQADRKVIAALEKARGESFGVLGAEIIEPLLLGALVNQGLRLIDEGVAQRTSDIDVVMIEGHGMARKTGGAMKAASLFGLFTIRRAIEAMEHADSAFWEPHPKLVELVKNGESLDRLDRSIL